MIRLPGNQQQAYLTNYLRVWFRHCRLAENCLCQGKLPVVFPHASPIAPPEALARFLRRPQTEN